MIYDCPRWSLEGSRQRGGRAKHSQCNQAETPYCIVGSSCGGGLGKAHSLQSQGSHSNGSPGLALEVNLI